MLHGLEDAFQWTITMATGKPICERKNVSTMKKLVSRLFRFALYCIGYILVINLTASLINDSLDEIDLVVLSVKSMKAGQKDILLATRKKLRMLT